MDLNTVETILHPACSEDVTRWESGQAWLAGGTWLFSEPQTQLHTLVDMGGFQWAPLEVSAQGLEIGANCKIVELDKFEPPSDWPAGPLLSKCCRSLLASFKIWNQATVGGNICMSLPAGAMVSLTTAMQAVYNLLPRNGPARQLDAIDFVTGVHSNRLANGELLRSIQIPIEALQLEYAFRRASLTKQGRSAALLIGTRCRRRGEFRLTVTAATIHPVQLRFANLPNQAELELAIQEKIPSELYLDDVHGTPGWREHLTSHFAEEIRQELGAT